MTLDEFFSSIGSPARSAIDRLGGEERVRRYLLRFAEDPTFAALSAAARRGDGAQAFRAAHTLKGLSATLGLERLSLAAAALTEQLRGGGIPDPALLFEVSKAYTEAVEMIKKL